MFLKNSGINLEIKCTGFEGGFVKCVQFLFIFVGEL